MCSPQMLITPQVITTTVQSSSSSSSSCHDDSSCCCCARAQKRVSFRTSLVTQVHEIEQIDPAQKDKLYYSPADYRRFRNEKKMEEQALAFAKNVNENSRVFAMKIRDYNKNKNDNLDAFGKQLPTSLPTRGGIRPVRVYGSAKMA